MSHWIRFTQTWLHFPNNTESPRHFPMEYIGSRTCNKAGVILLNAVRRISEQAWPSPCRGSLLDKAVHLAHFRHPDICTLSHRNIACIGWHIVSLPRSITIPQMVHHREHWCPPTSSYECSWGRSTHVLPLLDIFYDITCTHGPYVVPLWTLGYVEKPYSLDAANFCLVYVDIIFGLINHYYHLFSPFTDANNTFCSFRSYLHLVKMQCSTSSPYVFL